MWLSRSLPRGHAPCHVATHEWATLLDLHGTAWKVMEGHGRSIIHGRSVTLTVAKFERDELLSWIDARKVCGRRDARVSDAIPCSRSPPCQLPCLLPCLLPSGSDFPRWCRSVRPMSAHTFYPAEAQFGPRCWAGFRCGIDPFSASLKLVRLRGEPSILHYISCSYDFWLTKYRLLGSFPNTSTLQPA